MKRAIMNFKIYFLGTIVHKFLSIFKIIGNLSNRYYLIRKLKKIDKDSIIQSPFRINGMNNISIGDKVQIGKNAWLAAVPLCNKIKTACIEIRDGACIGDFSHIISVHKIIIEKNVLIANHVYISDNVHSYKDINVSIKNAPVEYKKDVIIGEDSWIGENVSIIGATIGKHCIIGANSVVTHDVPDYTVAVGVPSHPIKQYDRVRGEWLSLKR